MAAQSGPKQLSAGQYLFREGDPSDACYVVKSGKIAITKAKGTVEIELAELRSGQMFGEMAFFDSKLRSASAKAKIDSVLVCLPFASLQSQFRNIPEWLKAMIKTINDHLRDANQKIKNLESGNPEDEVEFTPYRITKLCAILGLVGSKYGEKSADGLILDYARLRNYTIQVFQEPTNKLDKLMTILQGLEILVVKDLGEGRKQVALKNLERLIKFVEFYNTYLFKEDGKRMTVDKKDMRQLKALMFYGPKATLDAKGQLKVNISQIQNDSMKDLGHVLTVNDWEALIEKKIVGEKLSEQSGVSLPIDMKLITELYTNWEIVYAVEDEGR